MNNSVLLLPHIQIHNANALSSPYTIGFPAVTAWLGAAHALERKLKENELDVSFTGVGIVSHRFNLQTYRGVGDFVNSIVGTANPVDKDGSRPAFIEEARCHLEVSLVLEIDTSNLTDSFKQELISQSEHILLAKLKMAGGDIQKLGDIEVLADFSHLKSKLMPGYALMERRDLMCKEMQQGGDALDAMLSHLVVHNHCQKTEDGAVRWFRERKATGSENQKGWIVPIAIGFQGISQLGKAKNQRDQATPHRFAESVITLGEFMMPYRLESINDLLWRYRADLKNDLYLCEQNQLQSEESDLQLQNQGKYYD